MAAVHYKFKYYKGSPRATVLHFILDLVTTSFNVVGIGSLINSFSNGQVLRGIVWIFALIAIVFTYFKLSDKIDGWGKAKEIERNARWEYLVKNDLREELYKLGKRQKKEEILMVVGLIVSIVVLVPIVASICILCAMYL